MPESFSGGDDRKRREAMEISKMPEAQEKKMDGDLVRWVLEFVVRESPNSNLVKSLLANGGLPFPADDSRSKKTVILRSLQEEIGKGSVSDEMLEWIEVLEELDRKDGIPASEAMKLAYCAVAVECTVRQKFDDAVDKIWKGRVGRLEGKKSELVTGELLKVRGLVEMGMVNLNSCLPVLKWRDGHDALELAEAYLKEAMVAMGPSFLNLAVTKGFGMECGESSGKVLEGSDRVERICDDVGDGADVSHDEDGRRLVCVEIPERKDGGSGETVEGSRGGVDGTTNEEEEHLLQNVGDGDKGEDEDGRMLVSEEIPVRKDGNSGETVEGSQGGVDGTTNGDIQNVGDGDKREDGDGMRLVREEIPVRKDGDSGETVEGSKVGADVTTNEEEQHLFRNVGDGDKGKGEDVLKRKDGGFDKGGEDGGSNQEGGDVPGMKKRKETDSEKIGGDAVKRKKKKSAAVKPVHHPRRSGPAKISDAEGADEIVDLTLENQDGNNVIAPPNQIPTGLASEEGESAANEQPPVLDKQKAKEVDAQPNEQHVLPPTSPTVKRPAGRVLPSASPPKKPIDTHLLQRRKKRKWTAEEETALYNGVQQFGVGSWKEILSSRRESFNNRTEVDLKDKWRNMTRWQR